MRDSDFNSGMPRFDRVMSCKLSWQLESGDFFLPKREFTMPSCRKMKKKQTECQSDCDRLKEVIAPPPLPPLPPLPRLLGRKQATVISVTNQEIARYWKQKRMVEEDHLLAAIKAAAHIRAHKLSEGDYLLFMESLEEEDDDNTTTKSLSQSDAQSKELRVGIKDWWTRSKYAYLNQPAAESMETFKPRASTFILQFQSFQVGSSSATTFGVF